MIYLLELFALHFGEGYSKIGIVGFGLARFAKNRGEFLDDGACNLWLLERRGLIMKKIFNINGDCKPDLHYMEMAS